MWLKRYVIVVSSLATPQMPQAWGAYFPSWVEVWITVAAFAGFLLLFALFSRFFPIVSVWEVTEKEPEKGEAPAAEPAETEAGA